MTEELELGLNQEEAASLYLILETAIDTLLHKKSILESIKSLPKEERPEGLVEEEALEGVINLNNTLTLQAKEFSTEVGQIIVELEKPKPLIIPPPNFKAKD